MLRLASAGLLALALSAGPVPAAPASGVPAEPAPADAPVTLANHRGVYDLALADSRGTRAVDSAAGRIVIDFRGDACRGYTMQTRQVTVLDSGETGSRTSDLRNTTFEDGEGHDFRFKTVTVLNGQATPAIDGSAVAGPDALKVRLKEPKKDQYTQEGPVLFPSLHMRHLIEAARAGRTTLAAKVFDGSDDGRKVYDTLAIIGHMAATPATVDRDKPLGQGEMATMPHWPVTLSYFTKGEGERTPIYTLSFDLYENGVSGALKLDYGDFAILGNLTRLDLDKPGTGKAGAGKGEANTGAKPCTP